MPTNRPLNYNWSSIDRTREGTRRRQDAALALREQGLAYIEIARQLGFVGSDGRPKAQSAAEAVRAATRRRGVANADTAIASVAEGSTLSFPLLPSQRTFGFEAEFFGITPSVATQALAQVGIIAPYVGYTHEGTTEWKIVTDQSVTSRGTGLHRGLELVSPVLRGEEGMALAAKAVNALQAAGGKTDKTCGLHIHLGMDGLTGSQVIKVLDLYSANQANINSLIAKSRWNNIFCQPIDTYTRHSRCVTTFEAATTSRETREARRYLSNYDRYHAVNLCAYAKYGTVEFRQHQGTLSGEKLTSWVRFLMGLTEKAVTLTDANNNFGSLSELLNGLPLADETRTFLTARAERLERSREDARLRAVGATN
jgi:Putative amidoligase enzyme